MIAMSFEAIFLGTNGSCAYNNGQRAHYGTNTLCVAVKAGDSTLILDAGTGLCDVPSHTDLQGKHTHVFLSHYHSDHINGLLFWDTLFDPDREVSFYGMNGVRAALEDSLAQPFSPVGFETFRAKMRFTDVGSPGIVSIDGGITVRSIALSHPGGSLGYRVEYDGRSLCYLTDVELSDHREDERLLSFVQNTDLLIADASFMNGQTIKGWGHSSSEECAELARRAEVKRLALYHYNHLASDEEITRQERTALAIFADTLASADGLRITI